MVVSIGDVGIDVVFNNSGWFHSKHKKHMLDVVAKQKRNVIKIVTMIVMMINIIYIVS